MLEKDEKQVSRRDFLKTSAITAGATVAATGVMPTTARGMRRVIGANDRINIGHIGVGGMGSSHVHEDAVALCDVDDNHLADNAKKLQGTPFLTKDYRKLLERKEVDAVMIATPDHWHAVMAVAACQAGKDVYSEKPTSKTIQEGQAMLNATRRYGRVMQIGSQGRSTFPAHAAAQYVRNGQIGTVNHVKVWHPQNVVGFSDGGWGEEKAPPPELDWEMWLGPARWKPYNPAYVHFHFRWMMDFGAGFIRDRGNHILSVVSWCMGADATGPVSVEATGKPLADSVYDVPVNMSVKWEFKNPDWTMTWDQPGEAEKMEGVQDYGWGAKLYGDKGTLLITGGDGGTDTEDKARNYQPPAGGFAPPLSKNHRENWLQAIRTREKPIMDIEIGLHVIVMPIIGNIAYQLGRKLQWDPVAMRFLGDEEANRFLAHPYRAPFHV